MRSKKWRMIAAGALYLLSVALVLARVIQLELQWERQYQSPEAVAQREREFAIAQKIYRKCRAPQKTIDEEPRYCGVIYRNRVMGKYVFVTRMWEPQDPDHWARLSSYDRMSDEEYLRGNYFSEVDPNTIVGPGDDRYEEYLTAWLRQ